MLIIRFFAERTTGSNNVSKLMLPFSYALLHDTNIDIGQILWTPFILSPKSKTQDVNVSMARSGLLY